jgi:2-polyprenyl-3-methyl-5-hydroxy-6-metoxy-1,4-benzoquinol methylase
MPNNRQNLYDNDEFFRAYSRARENPFVMNRTVEQPGIRELLPEINGARALDLGCGAGDFARWLVDQGATSVLGIDPSENMLKAGNNEPRPEIEYRQAFVEELELANAQFDLVVSSLMFHYVDDLKPVIEKIHKWLRTDGALVFSIEHPITTAIHGKRSGWLKDDSGERIGWEVTDYSSEGERVSRWIVDDVVKYHRTLATTLNMLSESGFRIDRISEAHATPEGETLDPGLLEERLRPPFLFVRAISE